MTAVERCIIRAASSGERIESGNFIPAFGAAELCGKEKPLIAEDAEKSRGVRKEDPEVRSVQRIGLLFHNAAE